jgi:hypothetical protein
MLRFDYRSWHFSPFRLFGNIFYSAWSAGILFALSFLGTRAFFVLLQYLNATSRTQDEEINTIQG